MSQPSKIVVFFFSGTGNAKRVALWIHEAAMQKNVECHLHNIAGFQQKEFAGIDKEALLVFISPVHGFNYPKITLNFIRRFPAGTNNVVLMNTRGGMKIGNWVTPGLTGIAFFISSFWLRNKGYKITAQIPCDMPSNWISLHPALNQNTVKYIHKTIHDRVASYFSRILNGEKLFPSHKEIVQDVLVSPISLLYYFIGRFIIAKTFYANHECDYCGLCIRECPVSAIKEIGNKPFWTVHCESCMHCMNFCPRKAIETSHGLLLLTTLLYFAVTGMVYRYALGGIELNSFVKFVISNLIFFVLMLVLYRLQHILLKNSFMAKLISYTSFTYYNFWGRYKSIADKLWKTK